MVGFLICLSILIDYYHLIVFSLFEGNHNGGEAFRLYNDYLRGKD